jgi:FOG: CheY-like receiver
MSSLAIDSRQDLVSSGYDVRLSWPVVPERFYKLVSEVFQDNGEPLKRFIDEREIYPVSEWDRSGSRVKRDFSSFSILLVEDNRVNQKVAVSILERAGFQCDIAESGEEAMHLAGSKKYDLVLMDCQIPDIDGFEITERIRKLDQEISKVPIVAMTASAMESDRKKCLDCGMNDFLPKPFRAEQLIQITAKWLGFD